MAERSTGKSRKSIGSGSSSINRGHRIGQKVDHLSKKRTGLDPRLKHLTKATRDGAPAPKVIRQKRSVEANIGLTAQSESLSLSADATSNDERNNCEGSDATSNEAIAPEEEIDEDEMVHKASIADVGEDWIEKAKRLEREAEEERRRIEEERLRETQRLEAEAARQRFEEEEKKFFQKAEEAKRLRMLKREQDKLARQARLQSSVFGREASDNAMKALEDIRKDQESQTQARMERIELSRIEREKKAERRKRTKDLLARTKEAKANGSLMLSKTTEKAIRRFSGIQNDAMGSIALKLLDLKSKGKDETKGSSLTSGAETTMPMHQPTEL
eukprot:UC4_evm5s1299